MFQTKQTMVITYEYLYKTCKAEIFNYKSLDFLFAQTSLTINFDFEIFHRLEFMVKEIMQQMGILKHGSGK